jgi:hypothetical protein
MPRTLSDTATAAVLAPQTGEVFDVLLTLDHPSMADGPIRVASEGLGTLPVAGVPGIVSRGNEFVALPFQFMLPGSEQNRTPNSVLEMDNISRDITAAARKMTSPAAVTAEVVLASDPDTVEVSIEGFSLVNVEYDQFIIRGTISVELLEHRPFPSVNITPSGFPGTF